MIGKRKTLDEFIEDAIKIHNNKYSYERVIYKNAYTKIEIYCKKCNTYFWQTPGNHMFKVILIT